jgi:hypothetical protein
MNSGFLLLNFLAFFAVVFYFLKPYQRVLLAFLLMSSFFELLPYEVAGIKLWDVGVLLLFVSGYSYFRINKEPCKRPLYYYFLVAFIALLGFVFFYSVTMYNYPLMETLKTSRQMILGYLSFFVFIRLFKNDPAALNKFHSFFFWFFLLLLSVNLLQYISGYQLLQGYVSKQKAGSIRSVPLFLPLASVYLWHTLSSFLSRSKISFFNILYVILYLISLVISFTRGYYVAITLMLLGMIFILLKDRRAFLTKSLVFLIIGLSLLSFMLITPKMARFVDRAQTTLNSVFQLGQSTRKININNNTFGLRLFILKERARLVVRHNPLLGYGFIHENRAHKDISFHFGTWDRKTKSIGFISADIAWANLVVYVGFLGIIIFLLFLFSFAVHHFRLRCQDSKLYLLNLSYLLSFMTMVILMWNGDSFTRYVQLQMYNLAASLYLSFACARSRTAKSPQIMADKEAYE